MKNEHKITHGNHNPDALQRVIENKRREHQQIESEDFNRFVERSTIHNIMCISDNLWFDLNRIDDSGAIASYKPVRPSSDTIAFDADPLETWTARLKKHERIVEYCKMMVKQVSK